MSQEGRRGSTSCERRLGARSPCGSLITWFAGTGTRPRQIQLRTGRHLVDLVPPSAGDSTGPGGLDHRCLSVTGTDLASARAWLLERGVTVDGDVVKRREAFGDGPSLYIPDPDGDRIELKAH